MVFSLCLDLVYSFMRTFAFEKLISLYNSYKWSDELLWSDQCFRHRVSHTTLESQKCIRMACLSSNLNSFTENS